MKINSSLLLFWRWIYLCTILSNEQVLKLNEAVKMISELFEKNPELVKSLPKFPNLSGIKITK